MAHDIMVRGHAGWAVHIFRRDALTSLLDGLVSLEMTGFQDTPNGLSAAEKCQRVQQAISVMANFESSVPEKRWVSDGVLELMEKFLKEYRAWNSYEGVDTCAQRQRQLEKLRKIRRKIANKIRSRDRVIALGLDLELIDAMYHALRDLVSIAPSEFIGLAKAITRYFSRRSDGFNSSSPDENENGRLE